MDCSLPGSSVHGIFQARILEWGAISFSNLVPPGNWAAAATAGTVYFQTLPHNSQGPTFDNTSNVRGFTGLQPLMALHSNLYPLGYLPAQLLGLGVNISRTKAAPVLGSALCFLPSSESWPRNRLLFLAL